MPILQDIQQNTQARVPINADKNVIKKSKYDKLKESENAFEKAFVNEMKKRQAKTPSRSYGKIGKNFKKAAKNSTKFTKSSVNSLNSTVDFTQLGGGGLPGAHDFLSFLTGDCMAGPLENFASEEEEFSFEKECERLKIIMDKYDCVNIFLSEGVGIYFIIDDAKKRKSLNELVRLYNTITLNDSLYSLSEVGEDELKTIIDAIIEKKKEEDRLAKEALKANAGSRSNTNSRNQFNPMSGGGGKWYFYNPSAISFGYSEFITKWGERRLEDDWRRKNKRQIFLDDDDGEEKDIYSQEYYMDLIPFTDSAKSATIDLIVESFYQLGLIYKEELKDFNEAVNAFETLIEAYPKNKYEPLSYYQLYTSYKLLKDDSSAEEYLQKLKQEYPDCEYLKMILDPEGYYSENKESIDSAFVYYEEMYTAFSNHDYEYVLAKNGSLDSLYEAHPIADQLSLLSALSHGHLFGEDTLKAKLDELINTYYSGEVVDEAREILQGLESKNTEPEETHFELDLNEEHYYILALEGGRTNINKTKITVSDFNRKFYNIKEYKTQSLMLNIDYQLIIVKPFENGNSALKYLEAIKNAEELKELLGTSDYEHFIISSSNFKAFYKDKSLDKYVVYFEGVYLKQK